MGSCRGLSASGIAGMVRGRVAVKDEAASLILASAGGGRSCSRSRSRADEADATGFVNGISDRPSHHASASTDPVTPESMRMR
mgnify:CR=1 FL=1